MQNNFDNINIYEVKASIDGRQIDENFMIGGKNIEDVITTTKKYVKEKYDRYDTDEIEILAVCISHKNIIINNNEI